MRIQNQTRFGSVLFRPVRLIAPQKEYYKYYYPGFDLYVVDDDNDRLYLERYLDKSKWFLLDENSHAASLLKETVKSSTNLDTIQKNLAALRRQIVRDCGVWRYNLEQAAKKESNNKQPDAVIYIFGPQPRGTTQRGGKFHERFPETSVDRALDHVTKVFTGHNDVKALEVTSEVHPEHSNQPCNFYKLSPPPQKEDFRYQDIPPPKPRKKK